MEIDIYQLRSEIMDVLHVLDCDPDGAHDLLVKMSEKYEAAQHSVQLTCATCGADLVLAGVKLPSGKIGCAACGTSN